jgi:hypothetical protein
MSFHGPEVREALVQMLEDFLDYCYMQIDFFSSNDPDGSDLHELVELIPAQGRGVYYYMINHYFDTLGVMSTITLVRQRVVDQSDRYNTTGRIYDFLLCIIFSLELEVVETLPLVDPEDSDPEPHEVRMEDVLELCCLYALHSTLEVSRLRLQHLETNTNAYLERLRVLLMRERLRMIYAFLCHRLDYLEAHSDDDDADTNA